MNTVPFPAAVDEELLRTLEKAFARHAGSDAHIRLPELKEALGLRSDYLAQRVLVAFDSNGDGVISREEFLGGVRALIVGTDTEKLRFAFRLHDHDGDGAISEQEMLRMIAISLAESDVAEKASQPPEWLAHTLFAVADTNKDGKLTFPEFEAAIAKRPDLLRKMTRSEALWISPNEDLLAWVGEKGERRGGPLWQRLENTFLPFVFVLGWAVANVAIFAFSMARAETTNTPLQIGIALGKCIDFDGALILVPMMRRLLTRLRPTWFGRVIPIDDAIDFHRLVGHTLFVLAIGHAAAITVGYLGGHSRSGVGQLFFFTDRGLTGFLLLCVFAIMWIFSLGVIRRSRRFELFYFTHLLYLVWFGLAIAHAPSFLVLGAVPLLGFALEQLVRLRRRGAATSIVATEALRSGVTRLSLERPAGFVFRAGDYVFVRVSAIARGEWHPFTISSAPEEALLTVHVRSLGNWTAALRRLAEEREARGAREPMAAYLDGPYGTPSARIFDSRHAVLIGAGIGVTPFASVLASLVRRANGDGAPTRLVKAYFFWLNRDQYSFEWFRKLLAELEKTDVRGLLDIHLCMTGGRAGATALGLEMARDIVHSAGRSDLITGLRTHTHVGAPDWRGMLGEIVRHHEPGSVDAFFCGPPGLARKLRRVAAEIGMNFHEERF